MPVAQFSSDIGVPSSSTTRLGKRAMIASGVVTGTGGSARWFGAGGVSCWRLFSTSALMALRDICEVRAVYSAPSAARIMLESP